MHLQKEIVSTFQTTQDVPTVEQIQDAVEEHLITHGYAKTAKAYILYRAEHAKMREMDENLMKIYEDLTFKPSEEADIKRENANIDADTAMGTMLKYGSEGAKCFYDAYVIPSEMAEAHRHGDIHIHDKDFYALTETCCQIDLIKLFKDGFSTGHGFYVNQTISAATPHWHALPFRQTKMKCTAVKAYLTLIMQWL